MSYFEKDGYYARDDAAHREASAWAGKGAEALELAGSGEPEAFRRASKARSPAGAGSGARR